MRKAALVAWAIFVLSLGTVIVWGTRVRRSHWEFNGDVIPQPVAVVLVSTAAFTLVLAIVLTGVRAFGLDQQLREVVGSGRGWRDDRGPLPAVLQAPEVDTTTVLHEYRTTWARYLPWARGRLVFLLPGVLTLVYGIVNVLLDHKLSSLGLSLALTIPPLVIFGIVHTVFVFTRSAILVHPNGVTIQGAWRRVVLDDTSNSGIVDGAANTGMYDMGPIYLNRSTKKRAAIWESGLDANVSAPNIVREHCPHAITFDQPSRQLAPYVSIFTRVPSLLLWLFLVPIVGVSTIVVLVSHLQ